MFGTQVYYSTVLTHEVRRPMTASTSSLLYKWYVGTTLAMSSTFVEDT